MAVNLEDLVARLRLDTSELDKGLAKAQSGLASAGSKMSKVGRTMSTHVTAPIAGIAIAGVHLAASFDKTMRQVAIATNGPSKALGDLAKKMGAETAFSANEAADAMLELAKGGMTAAQIQGGALKETMRLASAGGVDLADAATYMSNSMAAFGLKASDASQVTTALAGAANASSASVQSLGYGLAQASLGAKNAGLSLQETTGVLSLFDSKGLKGSDAGTSLKTMLTRLVPPTKSAQKAMDAMGLSFTNSDGSFKNIAQIAQQLHDKLGGLSEEQKNVALSTIFGSDATRAATILMDEGAKGVKKYTKASYDAATTTKLANSAMEGTSGALERAQGSLETAGLAIGQALAPSVEKIAGAVEQAANAFVGLNPHVQHIIIAFALAAAAIGPLLIGFGAVAKGASNVIKGVRDVGGAARDVGKGVRAGGQALGRFRDGFKSTEAASSAFSGKMGTLGGKVRGAFNGIGRGIAAGARGVATGAQAVVRGFATMAAAAGRGVVAAARWAASMVASAARAAAAMAATVARVVAGWILMGVQAMAAAVRMAAAWLIGLGPIALIGAAVIAVVALIVTHWSQVNAFLAATWNAIKAGVTAAWNGIKAVFSAVVGGIVNFVKAHWRLLIGIVLGPLGIIIGLVASHWQQVKAITSAVLHGVMNVVRAVWNGIKAAFSAVLGAIRAVVSFYFNAYRAIIGAVVHAIAAVIHAVFSGIKSFFVATWNAIRSAVTAAWNGIKSAVSRGIGAVMGLVRSLPGKIKGALSGAASWLVGIGKNVVQGLINGIKSMAGSITSTLVGLLPGPLRKFAGKLGIASPSKVFKKFGYWTVRGYTDGLDKNAHRVGDSMRRLGDHAKKAGKKHVVHESVAKMRRLANPPDPNGRRRDDHTGAWTGVPPAVQKHVTWAPTIINPRPERASASMFQTAQKLAYLGLDAAQEATA